MGQLGRIERDLETLFGRTDPALVHFDPGVEGNRLLWVVCSHVNVPPGKFAQSRIFRRMRGAKLFLNARGNDWYQAGVGGDLASIEALVSAVGRMSEGFRRTNFVGHSMGAYLVLALAHSFDRGGHFLATSPEPVLGRTATRSRVNRVKARAGWEDLIQRFGVGRPRTPGLTLFGGHDAIDALFLAERSAHEVFYGELAVVPHHHGVTEFLRSRRIYRPFLLSPARGLARLRERGFAVDPDGLGQADQFARFHATYDLARRGRIRRAVSLVEEDRAWNNPGWQALSAQVLRRAGAPERALEAAVLADRACPGVPDYVRERARALVALGDRRGATDLADEIADLRHAKFAPIRAELVESGLLHEPPLPPDALTSERDLERARRDALRSGALPGLAAEILPHLPALCDRPPLAREAFRLIVDAGLRRSALVAAARLPDPLGCELARQIAELMPDRAANDQLH
ncbi:MAG: hypothetical protein AAGC81_02525 [Pseudomonadota bacterium]